MKQTLEIIAASGTVNRLTITPTRVTVKIVNDLSELRRKQLLAFVDYVVEQFVVIDKTWRGVITFEHDGLTYIKTSMKSENPKESNRRYEVVV